MKSDKHSAVGDGCPEWRPRIGHLLGLATEDPDWIGWARHSSECAACRKALEAELRFRSLMSSIADPGRAMVSPAIMRRIRRRDPRAILRRHDLTWGLAGSLAGVILGILLTYTVFVAPESQATDDSQTSGVLTDEIDQAFGDWSMAGGEGG
jgi:hypothetical protein